MVETRRRAGFLHETVLRLLRDQPGAVSGLRLVDMIQAEGDAIPPSLVFRALRRLTDRGAVRKIALAKGYVVAGDAAPIDLVCRACGGLAETSAPEALAELHRAVATTGFAGTRMVVEVSGLCGRCAERRGSPR